MKNLTTLKDLLIEQLRELYNAEKQQYTALSTFKEKVSDRELRLVIQSHIDETNEHIQRLDDVFREMDVISYGEQSNAMNGLIKEGYDIISRGSDPQILDAGILAVMQQMEHFEMAGYGTVVAFAREMDFDEIADSLFQTLAEERRTEKRLSEISAKINERAVSPIIF